MPKKPTAVVPAKKHSRLGPSAFKSRELCASYKPTIGDSEASKIGTRLHDLMEKAVVTVTQHPEFLDLDEESQMDMLEKIQDYIDDLPKEKRYKELELDLTRYRIPDCDFGTADLVIDSGDEGDVVDYKFGQIPVDDAEVNIQGWLYCLGAFDKFKKWKRCRVHFLQPAIDELSTHIFERADMERMVVRALAIAARVKDQAGKEFNPVLHNCRWCSNKGACKALHELVMVGLSKNPTFELPTEVIEAEDMFNMALINQHGDKIYDFGVLMENYGSMLKSTLSKMAVEGVEIPNKKLITKRGKTTIVDPGGAQQILATSRFGITLAEFLTISRPSLTGLESLVAGRTERGQKDKEKQAMRELLAGEGVITSAPPSTYLVNG